MNFNNVDEIDKEAEKTPWLYKDEDMKDIKEILQRKCPDGNIGPLISMPDESQLDKIENNPDTELKICLNPVLSEILFYLDEKYSGISKELPMIFLHKFMKEYIKPGKL